MSKISNITVKKMRSRDFDNETQSYIAKHYKLEVQEEDLDIQTVMKVQGILNHAAYELNEALGYEQDQPAPKLTKRLNAIDRRLTKAEGVVEYKQKAGLL